MKNKEIFLNLISVLMVVLMSAISFAALEDVEIVKEEISPQIAEPGQELSVTISVWNKGNEDKDISVELLEENPFTIKSTDQSFPTTFGLCSGCRRSNTYYLTIDSIAVSGIYKLNFIVKEGETGIKKSIDIDIKGKSDLVFDVIDIGDEVTPNSEFQVKLKLKNEGSGIARDIKLKLSSDNFFLEGSDVISLDKLDAGTSKDLTLNLLAGSSIVKNVYAVPVNLDYKDHDGNSRSSTQKLSITVIDKAELNIKEVKIEPVKIKPGTEITIQIRIENVGEGDAENIKLQLVSEIEGNKESYLGRLEKDDDSPAFFSGTVLTSGTKTDKLTITYSDDLGEHTLTEEIKYTVKGISTSTWIIIVLVIVILALVGLLLISYLYRACKCHLQGKKCPMFKQHFNETVEKVKGVIKGK